MKNQIVAMQLAGLSGFPFEGHDAGGFYDWENKKGPDETLYRKWSMALGCFTPFWKPHGWGESRWPIDRSKESMKTAKFFTQLRYKLLPYTYKLAHESAVSGMPMVRAMVLEYQNNSFAWKYDQQFMWGDEILVVPNATVKDSVSLWLPTGNWYDFETNKILQGNRIMYYYSPDGSLVLFVKEGSILPMYYPALSTAFIDKEKMIINIYTGKDGKFTFYEDDGISEKYKLGEKRETVFLYNETNKEFSIGNAIGKYKTAPVFKSYKMNFIGTQNYKDILVNGKKIKKVEITDSSDGYYFDANLSTLTVTIGRRPVSKKITIKIEE
jgi:alpha-D-xyloside xylohydrolase